jgi:hypothetical protein
MKILMVICASRVIQWSFAFGVINQLKKTAFDNLMTTE